MQSYVKINQNQSRKETNNIRNETKDIATLENYQMKRDE